MQESLDVLIISVVFLGILSVLWTSGSRLRVQNLDLTQRLAEQAMDYVSLIQAAQMHEDSKHDPQGKGHAASLIHYNKVKSGITKDRLQEEAKKHGEKVGKILEEAEKPQSGMTITHG